MKVLTAHAITLAAEKTPHTFEATIQVPKNITDRAGVIFSNYDGGDGAQLSLEIYYGGKVRLFYKYDGQTVDRQFRNAVTYSYNFTTDVRADGPVHIAFTIDGLTANLYLNGELKETITLTAEIPTSLSNYCIGSDKRKSNAQPFVGTIYSVNLFSDIRTAEEIALDAVLVSPATDGLIYSKYFPATVDQQ